MLIGSLCRTTAALVAPSLPCPPLEIPPGGIGAWPHSHTQPPGPRDPHVPLAMVFLGLASHGVDAVSSWAVPLGFSCLCKLMAGPGAALHNEGERVFVEATVEMGALSVGQPWLISQLLPASLGSLI